MQDSFSLAYPVLANALSGLCARLGIRIRAYLTFHTWVLAASIVYISRCPPRPRLLEARQHNDLVFQGRAFEQDQAGATIHVALSAEVDIVFLLQHTTSRYTHTSINKCGIIVVVRRHRCRCRCMNLIGTTVEFNWIELLATVASLPVEHLVCSDDDWPTRHR